MSEKNLQDVVRESEALRELVESLEIGGGSRAFCVESTTATSDAPNSTHTAIIFHNLRDKILSMCTKTGTTDSPPHSLRKRNLLQLEMVHHLDSQTDKEMLQLFPLGDQDVVDINVQTKLVPYGSKSPAASSASPQLGALPSHNSNSQGESYLSSEHSGHSRARTRAQNALKYLTLRNKHHCDCETAERAAEDTPVRGRSRWKLPHVGFGRRTTAQ
ncbi:uncharacterized protein KNAG_0A07330 [Huiozyma naganishii CBS 8797]|uniref:Uncharacterized protein n=1 Tax=Huiozyma naganishii (strain ATCC MYA-139 / BCRC 22969 / CBS 8797 / KCTC 17520 / NBRC 10181 / NCYC 3082 / Yp74L-3) TaxID=1071383 RepID=J7S448_HUIN7|nr:hypothetical protein KNAG_0A07330 [Kazachstania naganishii CBS 8797]CCK68386.1 hypothetical protein KNAG_0A07330 [Kazachstania naganishii CBS 8797]